jgi:hypothetical protein
MKPLEVARAWWSVKDEWIVRKNKSHAIRQWEVVHDWGCDSVSDSTMKVISRHHNENAAFLKAERLEDAARGAAVLKAIKS